MIRKDLIATLRDRVLVIDEDLRSAREALDKVLVVIDEIAKRTAKVCPICECVYTPRRSNQTACCPRHARIHFNRRFKKPAARMA